MISWSSAFQGPTHSLLTPIQLGIKVSLGASQQCLLICSISLSPVIAAITVASNWSTVLSSFSSSTLLFSSHAIWAEQLTVAFSSSALFNFVHSFLSRFSVSRFQPSFLSNPPWPPLKFFLITPPFFL